MKLALGYIAFAALCAQPVQDPADTLEQARDKLLDAVPSLPKYVCVETIDRSYFSPEDRPEPHKVGDPPFSRPSCEQLKPLSADKRRGRSNLRLDHTDRLRVAVAVTQGHEFYSWTGPGTFSHSVEEILQTGPRGTGEFGAYLLDIFSNPSTRFRVLSESDKAIEYGFRVPIEASQYVVLAGKEWHSTGYSGSFDIDSASLALRRFTIATDELPPETSMCEVSTTADYQGTNALGLLVPRVSRTVEVKRDTAETERVTTFSDCHDSAASPAPIRPPEATSTLPEGTSFEVVLTSPIMLASAAAGDLISARLTEPILEPKSGRILGPLGATVTGRIIRLEHWLNLWKYFRVSIAFDTLEGDSIRSRFYAPKVFSFPTTDPMYLVRAGYKLEVRTIASASAK
jgi:hypothetical protein